MPVTFCAFRRKVRRDKKQEDPSLSSQESHKYTAKIIGAGYRMEVGPLLPGAGLGSLQEKGAFGARTTGLEKSLSRKILPSVKGCGN